MLLGDGGDLAHGVHGQVLGEGLAAEEAQPVHGVPLGELEQRDGALKMRKKLFFTPRHILLSVRCQEDYCEPVLYIYWAG